MDIEPAGRHRRRVPTVHANGLELAYDSRGSGEPLVLIMGFSVQRIYWPEGLCDALAARGFRVIRFDNRDVGESTWLEGVRAPELRSMIGRRLLNRPIAAPYTLGDMARDTVGLLDGLGLASAHVVGASMGGMIAQTLAIEHPERVRSLTSIMSHPGSRRSLLSKPEALGTLLAPPSKTRAESIDRSTELSAVLSGQGGYPVDRDYVRARAGLAWDRGHNPAGSVRQLAAMLASGDRRRGLAKVRAPTLVVHGGLDPLILPACGRATAKAIPGARLRLFDRMGHTLPRPIWEPLSDEIAQLASKR